MLSTARGMGMRGVTSWERVLMGVGNTAALLPTNEGETDTDRGTIKVQHMQWKKQSFPFQDVCECTQKMPAE